MRRIALAALYCLASTAVAQDAEKQSAIKSTAIRDGLYFLVGQGGNTVASVGPDGIYIVDDQYAPASDAIRAALKALGDKPVRFVINTHWHGDHTGGNESFGLGGSVIVAHDNVRKRMSTEQFIAALESKVPPSPAAALPVVTFTTETSLHLNGQTARIIHVADAHTDGDALVYFEQANVLHMGDVYFNGLYPFIDTSSGGTIDGFLAAIDKGLALANADTRIVPGHGALSSRAELAAYRTMLGGFRDRIAALKAEGKTLAEVRAAKPTAEFDEELGNAFIKPDQLVGFIYESL
ncbi:MAG TPA: MBL fold metallo-hydrolase [Candidatus Saccharimonadia bacterium]|nr:MBL fold metallo-hydrolase [Candidatus Saccharimonadia bacterium]